MLAQIDAAEAADGLCTRSVRDAIHPLIDLARRLFDLPTGVPLGDDVDLVRTMVAMTPSLRARLLFERANDESSQPSISRQQLPLAMLSIYLLAEAALAAGMKTVTYQTLSKLLTDFWGLVELLTYAHEVMVWRDDAIIDIANVADRAQRLQFIRLARALLPLAQRRNPMRLGDVMRLHAPNDPRELASFLTFLLPRLVGRVEPVGNRGVERRSSVKGNRTAGALQRFLLSHTDEEFLGTFYDQRAASARAAMSKRRL